MRYARKVTDKNGVILYTKENNSFEPSTPKAVKRTNEVVVIDDKPCSAGDVIAFEVFNHEDYPKGGVFILKEDYQNATAPLTSTETNKKPDMKNNKQLGREDSFISTPLERQMTSFGKNAEGDDFVNDKASRQAKKAQKKHDREEKQAAHKKEKEEKAAAKANPNQLYKEAQKKGFKGNFKEFMKTATDNGWIEKGINIAADLAERFGKKGKEKGASEGESGEDVLPASSESTSSDKVFGVIPKPIFWGGVVVVTAVGGYLIYRAVSKPKADAPAAGSAAPAA